MDNSRDIPSNWGCCVVRDYRQCVTLLSVCSDVEYLSLDYALGEEHTGLDVLAFMRENGICPHHINIHSCHWRGAPKMVEYAKKNFSGSIITEDKIGR